MGLHTRAVIRARGVQHVAKGGLIRASTSSRLSVVTASDRQ
jgi:hypothetical protein